MNTDGVTIYEIRKELENVIKATPANDTLPLSPEEFAKCYDHFVTGSTEYEMIARELSCAVLNNPYVSHGRGISILDIGAGCDSIARRLPSHVKYRITQFAAHGPNPSFHDGWTDRHLFRN